MELNFAKKPVFYFTSEIVQKDVFYGNKNVDQRLGANSKNAQFYFKFATFCIFLAFSNLNNAENNFFDQHPNVVLNIQH